MSPTVEPHAYHKINKTEKSGYQYHVGQHTHRVGGIAAYEIKNVFLKIISGITKQKYLSLTLRRPVKIGPGLAALELNIRCVLIIILSVVPKIFL
jgi:hypothetical protein